MIWRQLQPVTLTTYLLVMPGKLQHVKVGALFNQRYQHMHKRGNSLPTSSYLPTRWYHRMQHLLYVMYDVM